MDVYKYEKSNELYERAKKVIPSGIYGHLGTAHSTPLYCYPIFSDRAKGAYFWDVDNNRFIDYMCAYGPNILGYNDEDVNAAALEQLKKEDVCTTPSTKMIEFAELLVDTVNMADWAFFAKNGGDVTNFAYMVARAATGRKKIIIVRGNYHGVAPWMKAVGSAGTVENDQANNIYVDWNNVEQVEQAIRDNPGEIACFMSTPYYHPVYKTNEMPAEGYWQKIRKLCTDNGIVLAIDDVRCGFRLDLAGSDNYFGFKADLICFCKALANGYNVSALCGIDALKSAAESVYYTGSYWLSAVPFAAGIATIKKLKELDAANYMNKIGKMYIDGLVKLASSYGFDLEASGAPSLFYVKLNDSPEINEMWIAECVRRGVFMTNHHNHFTCCAMTEKDIDDSLAVADEAFKAVKSML
jgi:glutamate-1-semialdehyde 2,1-aminomutase